MHGPLESHWTPTVPWRTWTRASIPRAGDAACPVVLVHGQVVSSRYMVPLARELSRTHRVFAPDLPGQGHSEKPARALRPPELADALADWMAAEKLEKASFVGNSYGCNVLVELAVRHAERVDRLVLQGATGGPDHHNAFGLASRWLRSAAHEPLSLTPILLADLRDAGLPRALGTFRNLVQHDILDLLPRVSQPTLVLRGARDPISTRAWSERMARALPDAMTAEVPGAYHTANYSHAADVASFVRAFVG